MPCSLGMFCLAPTEDLRQVMSKSMIQTEGDRRYRAPYNLKCRKGAFVHKTMRVLLKSLASICIAQVFFGCESLSTERPASRRETLGWIAGAATIGLTGQEPAKAVADRPDSFDVQDFIRTGVVQQPMGVSGQAGKPRPETGVLLRDGSEVSRDARSGDVLAEILLKSGSDKVPVLTSFSSPWPLATGSVFDIECRDPRSGDGAFLAVSTDTKGKSISELKDSFFVDQVFAPTGRFSSYGQPTDVKVRDSKTKGNYREMELSFSTLSQSTQTEIPRQARLYATIPEGTNQAVMLIGSAYASRWKKGSDKVIASVGESFRAIPAPQTSLKMRAKERRS